MQDPFRYSDRLIEAGYTKDQAEAQVRTVIDMTNDHLATKDDIKSVRDEIKILSHEIDSRFKEITYKLDKFESKLEAAMYRGVGLSLGGMTALLALFEFLRS